MLEIRKITNKVWKHINDVDGEFILSKFYVKSEFSKFLIVEVYGSKRREFAINEIEVYDVGGSAETFASFTDLFQRLEELNYPAFYEDGVIVPNTLISTDTPNLLELGSDSNLFVEDAPSDGNEYVRKNSVWAVATGGGGVAEEDIWTYFKGDLYMCQATGASLSNFGYAGNPTLVGTGNNVSANLSSNYTTAPYFTWTRRQQLSSTVAGSNASATWGWKNISCGLGFYASAKSNIEMTTNGRFFLGLTDSTSDIGNVNPSTLTNILGFGIDSLDANLQILHNDNTGTATKVDLGSDFSINDNDNNTYLLEIWNFQGSSTVYFRIKNLLTEVTSAIIEVTTDVPTVTDGLAFHLWSNNGTDASAIRLHFSNHTLKRQS